MCDKYNVGWKHLKWKQYVAFNKQLKAQRRAVCKIILKYWYIYVAHLKGFLIKNCSILNSS